MLEAWSCWEGCSFLELALCTKHFRDHGMLAVPIHSMIVNELPLSEKHWSQYQCEEWRSPEHDLDGSGCETKLMRFTLVTTDISWQPWSPNYYFINKQRSRFFMRCRYPKLISLFNGSAKERLGKMYEYFPRECLRTCSSFWVTATGEERTNDHKVRTFLNIF